MTTKAAAWLEEHTAESDKIAPIADFGWDVVLGRTPHGNVTERHIAGAIADALCDAVDEKYGFGDTFAEKSTPHEAVAAAHKAIHENLSALCEEWFGKETPQITAVPETEQDLVRQSVRGPSTGKFQDYIRAVLLKSGAPCYVDESPEAYLSLEDLRDLYLKLGAMPCYPILGNPVTGGEEDIDALLDGMIARGVYTFEVIPYRNTRERLREILKGCEARHLPLFTGTEHNTLDEKPLTDPLSRDEEFLPYFERSARVVIGHQRAVAKDGPDAGFIKPDGTPSIEDPKERFEHFEKLGQDA